jgi:hypothetical protein
MKTKAIYRKHYSWGKLGHLTAVAIVGLVSGYAPAILAADPAIFGEEQPINMVYTFDLEDPSVPRVTSATEIPRENFRFDPIPGKPGVGTIQPRTPQKIHPLLERDIGRGAPDNIVEVIVTLREDQKIPLLPRLKPDQSRTSPANQAILSARNTLIESLAQKRKISQAELIQRMELYGMEVVEQFWLVNGFAARVPIGKVRLVAAHPEVVYIQPAFGGEPPPDSNPNNDVVAGRSQIQSDPYFNAALSVSSIAVLDSGVRNSHILFKNPRRLGIIRDCVNGGSLCQNTGSAVYNPLDNCNHGTSTIGIIGANSNLGARFRGVTEDIIDSFKVYSNCGLSQTAALRGFNAALARGDDVIVAEMQALEGQTGAIATAADNAYNAGAIIIAANGNCAINDACTAVPGTPRPRTVRSPAIAHKVIGVGAYSVLADDPLVANSLEGDPPTYQSRGPAPDGRIKPDVQGPTNTETASNASGIALTNPPFFTGTSGSTPYAAAAAGLLRNWLLANPGFGPFDNGQIYSWLIASGQRVLNDLDSRVNIQGTGHLKLLLGGTARIGKVLVSNGQTIDITFSTLSGDRRIDAAIWWPESTTQQHNDIDIRIFDPSGTVRASSISIPSVFERARVDGSPLTVGTWKLRIQGLNVPAGPQKAYFVVQRTPFIPTSR